MYDYITDILEEIPDYMKAVESATPAVYHMFTTNEDNPENMCKEGSIKFHHVTAKLLYLSKRAIPDLKLGVAFLCTRVKDTYKDDCKNLNQAMKCIQSTIGLPHILGIDDTNTIQWYVNAAFGVHHDMESHTGIMMSMGQRAASSKPTAQKLDTKRSNQEELVGIDDEISRIIWSGYFLV